MSLTELYSVQFKSSVIQSYVNLVLAWSAILILFVFGAKNVFGSSGFDFDFSLIWMEVAVNMRGDVQTHITVVQFLLNKWAQLSSLVLRQQGSYN